jgi:hypothetical protein
MAYPFDTDEMNDGAASPPLPAAGNGNGHDPAGAAPAAARRVAPPPSSRLAGEEEDAIYIDLRQGDPSDEEVVELLRQLALERAGLRGTSAHGRDAGGRGRPDEKRNREIERRHARLLWAQADSLSFPDDNSNRIDTMRRRERKVLARYGYSSYEEYLRDRADTSAPVPALVPAVANDGASVLSGSSRRWLLRALVLLVGLLVAALIVFVVRSRARDPEAGPTGPAAAGVTADAGSSPSVAAARTPRTTRAPATTSAPARSTQLAAFCAAVKIYTLDNLNTLAENGVADSRRMANAYAAMLTNAPSQIEDDVRALGPITMKVLAEIDKGTITTPQQMQQYLAAAPADEVTQWIAAQQVIVPQLPTLCG